ncbi:3'(2'),5'-bisphosphate nucleotidase [Geothermobacter hydrogeniphilus]|uniref:3'(2'),5'-bisphosphate nucleotidase CysQ n=1 Tax=Geothermobacter hydrogeniphilus TaxID=1969733 RepID=A0A2K2H9V0_9BACT|nr:3'(2'),5'-bisphosphate nucleotidase CysQ [Geothermobacter hydrogeniphilus]PNU20094.1 3'(2'),5'-bisphosphate nucleotidase [Geothermobacter hydrogeniphilus]
MTEQDNAIMDIDIARVCAIARAAGEAIMEIYAGEFNVELKGDQSPLTCADKASHQVISAGLGRNFPDIPILSEEGAEIAFEERRGWERFWLVDPLDGTKEFIKRNGEFTVNIALVEAGRPVLGVVYVPVPEKLYWGIEGEGAWLQTGQDEPCPVRVRNPDPAAGLKVVMSRSHPSPELAAYLERIKVAEAVSVGSSLKLCVVAEGLADIYPRLGPTMEWDTAAGHAVAVAAGARVTTPGGEPLRYNKQNLLNPHFIVAPPGLELPRV